MPIQAVSRAENINMAVRYTNWLTKSNLSFITPNYSQSKTYNTPRIIPEIKRFASCANGDNLEGFLVEHQNMLIFLARTQKMQTIYDVTKDMLDYFVKLYQFAYKNQISNNQSLSLTQEIKDQPRLIANHNTPQQEVTVLDHPQWLSNPSQIKELLEGKIYPNLSVLKFDGENVPYETDPICHNFFPQLERNQNLRLLEIENAEHFAPVGEYFHEFKNILEAKPSLTIKLKGALAGIRSYQNPYHHHERLIVENSVKVIPTNSSVQRNTQQDSETLVLENLVSN